jgi:alkylation response protein AidB-like acyl-CoA dehydrogenase
MIDSMKRRQPSPPMRHYTAEVAMYVNLESARSLLYWAAWAQDHALTDEATLAASTAKSIALRLGGMSQRA